LKKRDEFWIVIYEDYNDFSVNTQALFDDEESAINYYIELVNDINMITIILSQLKKMLMIV
jgi:hypothetical protein